MKNNPSRIFFLSGLGFTATLFGIWLAAHWPGIFNYDSYFVIDKLHAGSFDDWFSYLYILYLKILGQPSLSIGWTGIFQVLFAATAGSYLLSRIFKMGSPLWLCVGCLAAFALSPVNAIYNIFYIYDWPCAWLNVILSFSMALQLWRERNGGKPFSLNGLAVIAVLLTISIRFRSDGSPMLIVVPALLLFLYQMNSKRWLTFFSSVAASTLVFFVLLPALLDIQKYDDYSVTAFLNPLAYIMAHEGYPRDSSPQAEREKAVLDQIVNYDQLISDRSDYDIPVFHNGGKRESTPEQRKEFYLLSGKIFLRHFDRYLLNRGRMFGGIAGGSAAQYVTDGLTEDIPFGIALRDRLNVHKNSQFPLLLPHLQTIQMRVFYGSGPGHLLFATVYLPLMLFLLSLIFIRWLPCSGVVASLMLCRIPLVFLFAPASNFKYVYAISLSLFFFIPLFVLEVNYLRKRLKRARMPSVSSLVR